MVYSEHLNIGHSKFGIIGLLDFLVYQYSNGIFLITQLVLFEDQTHMSGFQANAQNSDNTPKIKKIRHILDQYSND